MEREWLTDGGVRLGVLSADRAGPGQGTSARVRVKSEESVHVPSSRLASPAVYASDDESENTTVPSSDEDETDDDETDDDEEEYAPPGAQVSTQPSLQ